MISGSINNTLNFQPAGQPDPNIFAQQCAYQCGLSLKDAQAELQKRYGDPKAQETGSIMPSVQNGNREVRAKKPCGLNPGKQELLSLGVPLYVIQQGDNVIMNYIRDNITGCMEKNT